MKYKVLIVDDSFSFRNLLKNAIKNSQNMYEVIGEAKNGQEAVDLYKKLNPDIVTMDLSMPVKDGVYATNEILRYNPQAKIIVVTGTTIDELIDSVKELGIKNIVRKPFQNNLLISMMNNMMIDEGASIEEEKFDVVTPVFVPKQENGGLKPIQSTPNKEFDEPILKPINQKPIEDKNIVPTIPTPKVEKEQKNKVTQPVFNTKELTHYEPIVEEVEEAQPIQPVQIVQIEKEEGTTVLMPIVDLEDNKSIVVEEDDDDDDVYTPPSLEDEDEDDDEDDVYTPPTPTTSISHNESIKPVVNTEKVVEETVYIPESHTNTDIYVPEPIENENNIYTPSNEGVYIPVEKDTYEPVVEKPYLEEDLNINKHVQEEIIQEPIEEIVESIVVEEVIQEEDSNVYQPIIEENNNNKEVDKHSEDVYRDVYKPMNEGVTEDIIPLPNLGQNVFTPQYEDKNAFELKGTSEQLKKPVHWEDDKNEAVEELTMVLPGSGNQSMVKPTPRQEPVRDERELINPQPTPQKPVQHQQHPSNVSNKGSAPKMPEPPRRPTPPNQPVPPNQFGVGRANTQAPSRPDNLSAQPPRPPRNMSEPIPPMQQGGYGRNNHPRNQYGQQGQPPMPPMQQGGRGQQQMQQPSNYYDRQQNNQYAVQPPLEQENYEIAPQENVQEKKKGGIFSFFFGLFNKKK